MSWIYLTSLKSLKYILKSNHLNPLLYSPNHSKDSFDFFNFLRHFMHWH